MTEHTPDESETLATNASLVERTTLQPGTVLAGRYRIETLIGEGGMGDVYRAKHLKIDKDVAIKVLAPEQMRRPRTVSRFLQEAKAASRIRHENVVDITDYGESDGCAFFVMEYLAGEDLSFLLKREGRLPWARIKPICIQLLRALSAAHAAEIVHRDIKPHNCFLTERGGKTDFVKVIDFGIAKLYGEGSGEQLTKTGAIIGTAEYMSPEQGMGAELDGRSDLYSVGIIMYRMLTGEVPYRGGNPMAILYQHIHSDRIPPSQVCPEAEIGPELDALVLKAMAKDREDRFESAEAFIAAIEAADPSAAGSSVIAAPPRRTGTWIAAAAAALVVIAGLGWAVLGGGDAPPSTDDPKAPAVADEQPGNPPGPGDSEDAGADTAVDTTAIAVATTGEAAGAEAEAGSSNDADEPTSSDTGSPAEATGPSDETDEPPPTGTERPVRRAMREIRGRLSKIDAKVRACGKKAGLFPGESVQVRVQIAPDGRVQSAKVQGAFSRSGAACIEDAVRSTRFSAAQRVQTVEHRFTL
ncbi:MAG: serine/threonine protein kinase [Myxococcales bacterium]|nr:serine/threonine protein kinase [Myxococcales bacterium]